MSESSHDDAVKEMVQRFRRNHSLFSEMCLKIRQKDGKFESFVMNTAQKHLHNMAEEQRKATGKVRIITLKGRQMGISTYIGSRGYRRATLYPGTNVYIMAHEQPASDSLFSMVSRFHDHNPIAPPKGKSNTRELDFPTLDSSYIVGTAGAKAGGRSRTFTFLHWSEVAFSANAADHFMSSVQAVPDLPGTEIFLESTANGVSGEFYERYQEAEAGKSDYKAVFLPWFWAKEYRREPPPGFILSSDAEEDTFSEAEYARLFGLDDWQMCWRRAKIASELRTAAMFDQEYPATSSLAFQSTGKNTFISSHHVLRARKNTVISGGPLVFGIDPAGPGGDRFAIAARRGHRVEWVIWRDKISAVEATEWVDSLIQKHKPARVFVDAGGLGSPIIDFLKAKRTEYKLLVKAVNFGATSQSKNARPRMPGPKNRRAEMWQRLADWLQLEEGVDLPDLDVLQGDLTTVRRKPNLTNDLELESKDDMRARGARSPDLGDAVALTFADLSHIVSYDKGPREKTYAPQIIDRQESNTNPNAWQGF